EHFQQMAGLICYYSGIKFHYLHITRDEQNGRHLRVMSIAADQGDGVSAPVRLPDSGKVFLRAEIDEERLHFGYSLDGKAWQWLPQLFDASVLSDEAMLPGTANFTGNFVGMCCQDVSGMQRHADFDFFEYHERDFVADPTKS